LQTVPAMSNGFWRRLLHRWFIEYNPLYLLSAALVLGGTNLLSRGFAAEGSLVQMLGGAAVAELYAWTLVAGAALLVRIRLTRPAVLLALLAALYQGDPTLHNETCVYLGWIGALGSLVWVLSFIAKLRVLAWAMHIRVSRSALYLPSVGAVGFALLPRAFLVLDEQASTELVGLWAFGLFAAGFWTHRRLESRRPLDDWGNTVFRRARLGIWTLWASFAVLHFIAWSRYESLRLGVLLPVAALCLTRWLPSERTVWLAVPSTLGCVALFDPSMFSVSAVLAAATLLLRAFREPNLAFPSVAVAAGPYRVPNAGPRPFVPPTLFFARAGSDALLRLSLGSVFCVYLGIWTHGWAEGPWPAHVIALDVALCAVVLLVAWRRRAWAAVAPLGLAGIHFMLERRMIPAPSSIVEWGAASVALGFLLLLGSLAVAYFARGWRCQPAVGGDPDG
jgi:hypothetical protein